MNERWPAWMAPVALLSALMFSLLCGSVVRGIADVSGSDPDADWVTLVGTVIQDGSFVLAAILFAGLVGRPSAADFGLRRTRFWRSLRAIVMTWVVLIVFAVVWSQITGVSSQDAQDQVVDQLGGRGSVVAVLSLVLLVTIVAPIAEEFFFRGFFFTALRNRLGFLIAALLTGTTFGAIHIFNFVDAEGNFDGDAALLSVPILMFFGFLLCWLYERTRSLYPPIVLHALNNALALTVTLST